MDRINRIISHPVWVDHIIKIRQAEQTRIFCRHDVPHLLDVARLAYIECLENHLRISKEQIYAAALLHDIGRAEQYLEGIPHDRAGAGVAETILSDCGFDLAERRQIVQAISGHRSGFSETRQDLAGILYRADKASRQCLFCDAVKECNWSEEKKNLTLKG